MRPGILSIVQRGLFLVVLLLTACQPSTPPPVRSSWSDQLAAIEQAIPNLNTDFILVEATASPKREPGDSYKPDEPIELGMYLAFQDQTSTQADANGNPLAVMRYVTFNDYHLASSLSVSDKETHEPDSSAPKFRARSIRLSAHDALSVTLAEGQAYMGVPVDRGNILIHLRTLEDNVVAWEFTFYKGKDHTLTILVDAQTGAILKRTET